MMATSPMSFGKLSFQRERARDVSASPVIVVYARVARNSLQGRVMNSVSEFRKTKAVPSGPHRLRTDGKPIIHAAASA